MSCGLEGYVAVEGCAGLDNRVWGPVLVRLFSISLCVSLLYQSVASSPHPSLRLAYLQVLLRMCEPFMGPNCQKAWPRLDPKYVSDPAARAGLALDETRLASTEPEVAAWVATWKNPSGGAEEERKRITVLGPSGQPAKPIGQYHFITDVFFMTARCLGIGYAKSIDNLKSFSRRLRSYEDAIADLENQLRRYPSIVVVCLVDYECTS